MVSAIIVAGGKGVRMSGPVRKQYRSLGTRPILGHTLLPFDRCDEVEKIFLVVPEGDFDFCHKNILSLLGLQDSVTLVPGGAERQDSVHNGLLAIGGKEKNGIVLIHDGVRPFIRHEQIMACISGAKEFGACILGIPAYDTLKRADKSGNIDKTLERGAIWLAQTPQAFQYELIMDAYKTAKDEGYVGTDDASLVERIGKKVKIINGSRLNIKITTPEDIQLAELIMNGEW